MEQTKLFCLYHNLEQGATFSRSSVLKELSQLAGQPQIQKASVLCRQLEHRLSKVAVLHKKADKTILRKFAEDADTEPMQVDSTMPDEQKCSLQCLDALVKFSLDIVGDDWQGAPGVFAGCMLQAGIEFDKKVRTITDKEWAVIDGVDSVDFIKLVKSPVVSNCMCMVPMCAWLRMGAWSVSQHAACTWGQRKQVPARAWLLLTNALYGMSPAAQGGWQHRHQRLCLRRAGGLQPQLHG